MSEVHFKPETTSNGGNANPSNTDPSLNPSSPFHIHPSEGPSSVTITPVLTDSNYRSWSRTSRMALISKNKMGFLTGAIAEPAATDPLRTPWERCNTLIMS
ncbi:Gag-polypeptide of LTR copia-type [Sesbania bispinosa]|nr:Gag-polypeptide of LTR copia-type [Sesbania bispinosa]